MLCLSCERRDTQLKLSCVSVACPQGQSHSADLSPAAWNERPSCYSVNCIVLAAGETPATKTDPSESSKWCEC